MGFFDLNIPYTESNKPNSGTDKSNRLKLAVKAMELGYNGVAYNRTITGVMSELDRCSISLFPLSSVLKVSPSISAAVSLHRSLLNVPASTPFRQYTRLTVVVDAPAQGSSLNSGNPILKSYDIVAVRPMKQESFDLACKNYEVDIISIDFSENRFRLKQPLIKAAIERGVYFEITYSGLIMDAQLRRQMIGNAKLLVDWTRGKNLIFSSAAPFVTELRGPYDVANLASLLGISMERAKAALSKTCRSLVANALRKKKFYKEAIRVELISSVKQFEEAGLDDWLKWDPISSGEGDLQLDDLAKSFAATGKESKTVKAINFDSIIDGLPSHGLHIKDMVSGIKGTAEPYEAGRHLSAATKAGKSVATDEMPVESDMRDLPQKDQTLLMDTGEGSQPLNFEDSEILSASETLEALANAKEVTSCPVLAEEVKLPTDSSACFYCIGAEPQDQREDVYKTVSERNITSVDNGTVPTLVRITETATTGNSISFEDSECPAMQSERAKSISVDVHLGQPVVAPSQTCIESTAQGKGDPSLSFSDAFLHKEISGGEHKRDDRDVSILDDNASMPSYSGITSYEVVPVLEHMIETGDVSIVSADTSATLISYDEMRNKSEGDPSLSLSDVSLHKEISEGKHIRDGGDVSVLHDNSSMPSYSGVTSYEVFPVLQHMTGTGDVSVVPAEISATLRSCDDMQNKSDNSICNGEPSEDAVMEDQVKLEDHTGINHPPGSSSGKVRRRQRRSQISRLFPLKRLLNPSPFKKKARKSKAKSKTTSISKRSG